MSQDYYETLQVHPRADDEAIRAAYERLRGLYDPGRLEGAADELVSIARRKLAAIESAYTVLSDPQRRAAYDQALAAPPARSAEPEAPLGDPAIDTLPDYRPLPPAARAERPYRFDHEPVVPAPVRGHGSATAIAVVAATLLSVVVVSLLITNWGVLTQPARTAQASPTPAITAMDQYEQAIVEARQATEQSPADPQAWVMLGNYLYDSAQIVRENMPDSSLYQERMPRWLEAGQAYARALDLQPDNPPVLADKGISLCYYGAGIGDQSFVTQGLADMRAAVAALPNDPLVQLNLGNCLVSTLPPQSEEAIASWQKVLQITPADSPLAQRARELINQHQGR
jgi:cytochrome c-type biogenesis protein CcmH/NrfG